MSELHLLVLMLGIPGSGRTYFAEALAKTIDAVYVNGVKPIVVWVQTPLEVAVKHIQERKETSTQMRLTADDAKVYVAKIAEEVESPTEGKGLIKIDGTARLEAQLTLFEKQLEELS